MILTFLIPIFSVFSWSISIFSVNSSSSTSNTWGISVWGTRISWSGWSSTPSSSSLSCSSSSFCCWTLWAVVSWVVNIQNTEICFHYFENYLVPGENLVSLAAPGYFNIIWSTILQNCAHRQSFEKCSRIEDNLDNVLLWLIAHLRKDVFWSLIFGAQFWRQSASSPSEVLSRLDSILHLLETFFFDKL